MASSGDPLAEVIAGGFSTMSVEENKTLVRALLEALDDHGPKAIEPFVSPDVRMHMPFSPEPLNRTQWQEFSTAFLRGVPDGRHHFEDILGQGDLVAIRGTYTGTHQGELMGIPATGRPIDMTWTMIARVVNGQLVEGHVIVDALGMLQQLGAIPATPAATAA
jgi:predicted ester cyclase